MKGIFKRILVCIISVVFLFTGLFVFYEDAYAENNININAKAGIIYLEDTGDILWSKGLDYVCDAASTTKLLTAFVALEYLTLDEYVTFNDEQMTVEELLHYALLASDNDAAVCLAEEAAIKAGTDFDGFIQLMNNEAKDVGCTDAVYYNPSGLYDENMINIVDLVKVSKYALSNDDVRRIAGTARYTTQSGVEIKTTNLFLLGYEGTDGEGNEVKVDILDNMIAAKTGTFGHGVYHGDMISLCTINGMNCYIGILDCEEEQRYSDMKILIDYAQEIVNPYVEFEANFEPEELGKVWGGSTNIIQGYAKDQGVINLPVGVSPSLVTVETIYNEHLDAPIHIGDKIGHINILLSDEVVKTIDLLAKSDLSEGWFLSKYRITNKQTLIAGGVVFVIILFFIIILSIRASNIKKMKKRREEMVKEAARKKLAQEEDRKRRNWTYK